MLFSGKIRFHDVARLTARCVLFATICQYSPLFAAIQHYSRLFTTIRDYSHHSYYSLFATIRYSGFPDTLFLLIIALQKRPGRDSWPYKLIFFGRENSMTFSRHFRFCGFDHFVSVIFSIGLCTNKLRFWWLFRSRFSVFDKDKIRFSDLLRRRRQQERLLKM